MFDVTAAGIGTFAGAFLAAFGVNSFRSLLRLNGQIKYWKSKAEGCEPPTQGKEIGDPLVEMEGRLNEKLHYIERIRGCEFSELFQEHIKCTHDVIANQHITSKELINAIDDHIVGMAQLSQFLKSLNGRLRVDDTVKTKEN